MIDAPMFRTSAYCTEKTLQYFNVLKLNVSYWKESSILHTHARAHTISLSLYSSTISISPPSLSFSLHSKTSFPAHSLSFILQFQDFYFSKPRGRSQSRSMSPTITSKSPSASDRRASSRHRMTPVRLKASSPARPAQKKSAGHLRLATEVTSA